MSFVQWLVGSYEPSHYTQPGCFWDNPQRMLPWVALALLIVFMTLFSFRENGNGSR